MVNSTANLTISAALDMYTDLGFDAIPLRAGTEFPLGRAWQARSVNRLWRNAPNKVNIGLRGGGVIRAAFLDCDEKNSPGTFEAAKRWLAGLGYLPGDYPVVASSSGVGRHVYGVLVDELPGSIRKLAPAFGAGELRYGPAGYVAAPPSEVFGCMPYRLLEGDLRQLPHLELRDILPIIGNRDLAATAGLHMSRKASALLQGHWSEEYKSRSEADAVLVASLVNSGFPFETVLELFERYPTSGKYKELRATKDEKAALHYLRQTYTEAARWARSHDSSARRIAEGAVRWASSRPWPGRSGAVDRNVFLAHMQLAYRAGKLMWAASSRDLAVLAGLSSNTTAAKASHRLCSLGFIVLEAPAVADCAHIYRLCLPRDILTHSPSTAGVRKCASLSPSHDAFRFRGFGKSAEQIMQAIHEEPASIKEIASRTGRSQKTVQRWLKAMSIFADPLTGECLSLVVCDDSQRWHALPVDLDRIAGALGTSGSGCRQRAKYAAERAAHHRALLQQRPAVMRPSGEDDEV